jgi:hypothetical protein
MLGNTRLPDDIDKIKLAAMMKVMTALYNLEETIVKT